MTIPRSITRGITRSITRGITATDDAATLDLNFAAGVLPSSPAYTFTGNNVRTYLDVGGTIQTAGTDAPRFDHDISGVPLGMLIEGAGTNVITQSAAFGSAPWAASESVVTDNDDVAPDGTTTADLVQNNTNSAAHLVYINAPGLTPTTPYTYSKFFKRDDHDWIALRVDDTDGASYGHFNLNTGSVGTADAGVTATIKAYPNGWYRCGVSKAANGAVTFVNTYLVSADNGKNTAYVGTGTGVWMWGAQLEEKGFPTSYMATTGSSASRTEDVMSFSDLSWYNASQGALVMEFDVASLTGSDKSVGFIQSGSSSDFSNAIGMYADPSVVDLWSSSSSTVYYRWFAGPSISADTTVKAGITYASNNTVGAVDGTVDTTDTAYVAPLSPTSLYVGSGAGGAPLFGHVKRIRYWPARLSNDDLTALTV